MSNELLTLSHLLSVHFTRTIIGRWPHTQQQVDVPVGSRRTSARYVGRTLLNRTTLCHWYAVAVAVANACAFCAKV